MNLILVRTAYTASTTIGELLVGHSLFCHTLEDTVRPAQAPKVPGFTAIPPGRYKVMVTMSTRFKRRMPVLFGVPGFDGVRLHGGNTSKDTQGCIIVAHAVLSDYTVQGSAEKELLAILDGSPESHWIEVLNTYPYKGV